MQREINNILLAAIANNKIPREIETIYLYGSLLKGRIREDSDIDIAILPSFNTRHSLRLELISKIEALFSTIFAKIDIHNEISVVDLMNKYISLALQYNIITTGIALYTNNYSERMEFENFVKGEYFDFAPYLQSLRKRKNGNIFKKV